MTNSLPKTIQIFLPDGNARSVRIAEITSRTVQAIQIPRSKIKAAADREEASRVGIYFLFGEDEESSKPLAYIGEAESCHDRVKQHNQQKDFWSTAIAITSKTHSFTKAHARYLEYHCYQKAAEIDRYRLANSQVPTKPYISEPMQADLLDNFGTIRTLLSMLGYPILEDLGASIDDKRTLFCRSKDADAHGEYVEDGFVVFAGSKANTDETPSAGSALRKRRQRLQEDKILIPQNGYLQFAEDYIFNSPSGAATTVLGRQANGWTEWKDRNGTTLDELERQ